MIQRLFPSAMWHPERLRVWPSGVSQRVWAQSGREEARAETKGPLRVPAWFKRTCPRPSHSCPLAPSWSRRPQSLESQGQGLGMERRHPQGLMETEECWARKAGAVQTQKAAAGPRRTRGASAWLPAFPGWAERPQSQGFQFLEHCCPSAPAPGHGGWRTPAFAYRPGAG